MPNAPNLTARRYEWAAWTSVALVFVGDALAAPPVAIGALYLLSLALAIRARRPTAVRRVAAVCLFLLAVSAAVAAGSSEGDSRVALANHALSGAAVAAILWSQAAPRRAPASPTVMMALSDAAGEPQSGGGSSHAEGDADRDSDDSDEFEIDEVFELPDRERRRSRGASDPPTVQDQSITFNMLVESVLRMGLVAHSQLEEVLDLESLDPGRLARELVARKALTAHQATMLLSGRGEELIFDDYIVTDLIGEGGVGVVLKAIRRGGRQPLAIKRLSATTDMTAAARTRFQREIEAVTQLNHPNIVRAIGAGAMRGAPFLVMEYVAGDNLHHIVSRDGALPAAAAVASLAQAARGLAYAHSKGLVHRDIKPSNLMRTREGVIKILDFGLARVQSMEVLDPTEQGAAEVTRTGFFFGTVEYTSPEQAQDFKRADHRADIYSLGCSLYFLLEGRSPLRRREATETLRHLLFDKHPQPIPPLTVDVPASLREFFNCMVHRDPLHRPQSADEVVARLELESHRLR